MTLLDIVPAAAVLIFAPALWFTRASQRYFEAVSRRTGAVRTQREDWERYLASGELLPRSDTPRRLSALLNYQEDPELEALRRVALRRAFVLPVAVVLAVPVAMIVTGLVLAIAGRVIREAPALELGPLSLGLPELSMLAIVAAWAVLALLSRTRFMVVPPRLAILGTLASLAALIAFTLLRAAISS